MEHNITTLLEPLADQMSAADYALLMRWTWDAHTRVTSACVPITIHQLIANNADNYDHAIAVIIKEFEAKKDKIRDDYAARDAARAEWEKNALLQQEQKEREATEKRTREEAAQVKRDTRRDTLVNAIARRAGYESVETLRQCDESVYATIVSAVESYKWGADGDLLVDQDVDTTVAAGAIYNKVLVPQSILRNSRKTNAVENDPKESLVFGTSTTAPPTAQKRDDDLPVPESRPNREQVTNLALNLLRSNFERSYTYNQIAQALDLTYKDAYKDVSRVAQALAGDARNTGVITYNVKDQKKATIKLYKYAPWRELIDRDPSQTDRVVRRDMFRLITAEPALSWAALRERMRDAYGHLDNAIIDRARKALLEASKVICIKGPRGAQMHYVADAIAGSEAAFDAVQKI